MNDRYSLNSLRYLQYAWFHTSRIGVVIPMPAWLALRVYLFHTFFLEAETWGAGRTWLAGCAIPKLINGAVSCCELQINR